MQLFYKLYQRLLVYANKRFTIVKDMNSVDEFSGYDLNEVGKVRNKLYENTELFDSWRV